MEYRTFVNGFGRRPGEQTVFIMASDYFFVSSSLIKEVASLGGDLQGIDPELVGRHVYPGLLPWVDVIRS